MLCFDNDAIGIYCSKMFLCGDRLEIMPWHRSSFCEKLLGLNKTRPILEKIPRSKIPAFQKGNLILEFFLIFVYFILQSAQFAQVLKKQDKIVQLKQQD